MTPASALHRRLRILYLVSHPIQYQAPMLRYLEASGRLHVHTIYIRSLGTSSYFDPGFGVTLQWDVPLTDGYSHEFLPSVGVADQVTRWSPVLRGLTRAAGRFNPDAVWVHGYDHVNALRLLAWARPRRVPALVRAEVEWSDAHGGGVARALKTVALRAAFPAVDGFLTIGQRNRRFYMEHGVPEGKLFDAPYAVDNNRFAAVRGRGGPDDLSRAHGLPAGRPTFLFAGKLIERKRPLDAVCAVSRLRDLHNIDANLIIVGSGDLEVEVKERIGRLGLKDRVVLAGFLNQQEIAGAYAQATALLLTSSRERWGLVANEAMAAGTPVVAYRSVGCADDLVLDGVSGKVVDTGDVVGLASALADMTRDDYRNRLADGAIHRVEKFSYGAIETGLLAAVGAQR